MRGYDATGRTTGKNAVRLREYLTICGGELTDGHEAIKIAAGVLEDIGNVSPITRQMSGQAVRLKVVRENNFALVFTDYVCCTRSQARYSRVPQRNVIKFRAIGWLGAMHFNPTACL